MKMFVFAAALAFAPFVHADQQPVQDQAAQCSAQMDQNQELTQTCEQRLACQEDGLQNTECQAYCAANPTDSDACAVDQSSSDLAMSSLARACYWRGHVRVCVGRDHWRDRHCHWRDRWGRCRR